MPALAIGMEPADERLLDETPRDPKNGYVNEAREYGYGVIQITASDMGVELYTDFGFVHNRHFDYSRIL
mgnify:FL=1